MVGAGASKEPVTRSCLGKPQARECFLPKRESLPRAEIWSMVPCSRHKPAPLLKGQMAKIEATAPNHPQLQQESFCSLWYCSTLHEDFLREKDFLSPCNCYLQSSGKPYIPYFRKLVCKKKKNNPHSCSQSLSPNSWQSGQTSSWELQICWVQCLSCTSSGLPTLGWLPRSILWNRGTAQISVIF